jgi:hypothetical protein
LELIDCATPPTTLAGARALAGASIAIAPLDRDREIEFEGGDAEWLALTVVEFLADPMPAAPPAMIRKEMSAETPHQAGQIGNWEPCSLSKADTT